MRHQIRRYLTPFLAVIALVLLAVGVGAYILDKQRLRFPLIEEQPHRLQVELSDAQAVLPGQGQTVRVAGIRIGDIGEVELEDGRAVVTLEIDRRHEELIRSDATALLRAKTALKDMFIELDPGHAEPLEDGERIPAENTAPDIDLDEVLSAVDSDTRSYLKLLASGAGKGLRGRGADAREALRRLGPTHRDLARVGRAVARRRKNVRRLVGTYGSLVRELGEGDREIVRLVRAGNSALGALAEESPSLSGSISRLPGTLRETRGALAGADRLGQRLGPTLRSLRPAVRALGPAAEAIEPLAREGTPILRDQVRPLARTAPSRLEDLGAAAGDLADSSRGLEISLTKVNRLLNILAFNPGGTEGLTGDLDRDRARQEGYLHYLAWASQATTTLLGTADGQGVFRRLTVGDLRCGALASLGLPKAVSDQLGAAGLCNEDAP